MNYEVTSENDYEGGFRRFFLQGYEVTSENGNAVQISHLLFANENLFFVQLS